MDSTKTAVTPPPQGIALVRGEFAPVFWEPLGKRGERLVAGFLLALNDRPATAHVTLHHQRLLEFISVGKSESASGIIQFAFEFFSKTLSAGGIIEDLRSPFASMSIGRIEPISGRDETEVTVRATRLCTLLGYMPDLRPKVDPAHVAAKTLGFVRDVRQQIRSVDKKLAALAMKREQFFSIGSSQMRVHFQYHGRYAQFCSLPLPNARAEIATECSARLTDLELIRKMNPAARVALCINTQSLDLASGYAGKSNATLLVRERTLAYAKALGIPAQLYKSPNDAAGFLQELAHQQ